eukprot:gnl/MRDRNA2_/MRDRNA2_152125_c0_seq1.p1 gnl/MRDRNA2_/MRDRNA2_152125_c0~~gnl/MRDRNA2_/MRDRNA2_152125_c0_seq1.p1  ORF type:complete len:505 (-),score=49.62 gnl/MRDRNA2_/MRDRNA2_152125_c0_seq1:23-1537(-)
MHVVLSCCGPFSMNGASYFKLLAAAICAFARATGSDWRFLHAYPNQYVAQKLTNGEHITIDGDLNDPAWMEVSFTTSPFQDIAQPLFPDWALPAQYKSQVKVRWDSDFLYVGAMLGETLVTGVVTGHNPTLTSPNPLGNVPYYDNDFEIFVDVSGTNYFYKEFEMNFLNATYDVLWRAADSGIGSTGVPCCSDNTCTRWCQNSSYPLFKGTWSMFPLMKTATKKHSGGWSAEIAFPLRGNAQSGGLLDGGAGWDRFDPNTGAKYWLVDFSRAEHPFFTDNSSAFGVLCPVIQKTQPTLLGDDQWSCYWEWAWQPVGGHRYMHNPNTWGFLQFSSGSKEQLCKNMEWPARYVLSQVYQVMIAYVQVHGTYSADLAMLLRNNDFCQVSNGCNRTDMQEVLTTLKDVFKLQVATNNTATSCVRYATGATIPAAPYGGPCFLATVNMTLSVPGTSRFVQGSIREDRFLDVKTLEHGKEADARNRVGQDTLCLQDFHGMAPLSTNLAFV